MIISYSIIQLFNYLSNQALVNTGAWFFYAYQLQKLQTDLQPHNYSHIDTAVHWCITQGHTYN